LGHLRIKSATFAIKSEEIMIDSTLCPQSIDGTDRDDLGRTGPARAATRVWSLSAIEAHRIHRPWALHCIALRWRWPMRMRTRMPVPVASDRQSRSLTEGPIGKRRNHSQEFGGRNTAVDPRNLVGRTGDSEIPSTICARI
jgi:hypothetical protein